MKEYEEYEIDLLQVLEVVKKNLILFMIICGICVTVGFAVTKLFMEEEFTSSSDVIVVQNKDEKSSNNDITYSDVQLSQKLANTYSQILVSDIVTDKVVDELNLLNEKGISSSGLKRMISAENINSTEIIRVHVKTNDPKLSADIANKVVEVFKEEIYGIMEVDNITILNPAKVPTEKSGPSTVRNMAIAGLIGLVICGIITLIKVLTDTKIKTEEEVKAVLSYPIIGIIPEIKVTESEKRSLWLNQVVN